MSVLISISLLSCHLESEYQLNLLSPLWIQEFCVLVQSFILQQMEDTSPWSDMNMDLETEEQPLLKQLLKRLDSIEISGKKASSLLS